MNKRRPCCELYHSEGVFCHTKTPVAETYSKGAIALSNDIAAPPRLAPRATDVSSDSAGDSDAAGHAEPPSGRLRRVLTAPVRGVGKLPGIAVLMPMALGATVATVAPHDVAFG